MQHDDYDDELPTDTQNQIQHSVFNSSNIAAEIGQGTLNLNEDELHAIIESVTSGKSVSYKKLIFQAFCAAISHEDQVRFVIDYLSNVQNVKSNSKFASAKNRILAYRVSQMDPVQQKEILAEGFDDDGEDGAGDKLLTVLQKMDIGNIMVIVCIWNNGVTIGESKLRGGEFFRMVTERARELLTVIKEGVMQTEMEDASSVSPKRQHGDLLTHKTGHSPTHSIVVAANSYGGLGQDKIDE